MRAFASPLLTLVLACSAPAVAPPRSSPAPPPAAPPAPAPVDPLNLGFEAADPDERHGGARSLRLVAAGPSRFAVAATVMPAGPARGKRVRVTGWVKTRDVTDGYAGLWLRADSAAGDQLVLDNMAERGRTG